VWMYKSFLSMTLRSMASHPMSQPEEIAKTAMVNF
jgi:hypothetical protein